MKKSLMIIGGIVVVIVAVIVVLFVVTYFSSKKMVCKSKEGNITLMYNKKKLTGYTAKNITFDMDVAKSAVERLGINEYLNQFEAWFETNTTGKCER